MNSAEKVADLVKLKEVFETYELSDSVVNKGKVLESSKDDNKIRFVFTEDEEPKILSFMGLAKGVPFAFSSKVSDSINVKKEKVSPESFGTNYIFISGILDKPDVTIGYTGQSLKEIFDSVSKLV